MQGLAIVLAACAFAPSTSHAQVLTKTEVGKAMRGPFAVGTRPRNVTVEITTTTSKGPDGVGAWRDSFVVRDRHGKELLRHDYPLEEDTDLNVVPAVVPLPGGGTALLIMRSFSPAAPGSGADGQLFGFAGDGGFVPLTGIIQPNLDETEASAFRVTRLAADPSRLVVEVEEWTGSFTVIRHYPIDPEAAPSDDAVAIEEKHYAIRIDVKDAARRREDSELDPVVTIRSAPSIDAPGQPYILEPASTIEFLDAAYDESDWWLHVKIDGREGYVTNRDGAREFDRLGLPDAG